MLAANPDLEALPSVRKFNHWVATAKPHSILCYARGMWLEKRYEPRFLAKRMRAVARAAQEAHEAGRVELVQRRNDQGSLDYLAIKRRNPR